MQVVVKAPLIDVKIEGKGVKRFIDIVKKSIPNVQIIDKDKEEYIDIDDWDYFKEMESRLTPSVILKIRRENAGLTQKSLADKCGIASSNIALMERGKRAIGARTAKKLAEALGCDAGDFI